MDDGGTYADLLGLNGQNTAPTDDVNKKKEEQSKIPRYQDTSKDTKIPTHESLLDSSDIEDIRLIVKETGTAAS